MPARLRDVDHFDASASDSSAGHASTGPRPKRSKHGTGDFDVWSTASWAAASAPQSSHATSQRGMSPLRTDMPAGTLSPNADDEATMELLVRLVSEDKNSRAQTPQSDSDDLGHDDLMAILAQPSRYHATQQHSAAPKVCRCFCGSKRCSGWL